MIDEQILNRLRENDPLLTTLDLSDSNISFAQVQAIADALYVNTSLTTLDLSFNNISVAGAHAIAAAMRVNTTLHILDLEYIKFGVAGMQVLTNMLQLNFTLEALMVFEENVDELARPVFNSELAQNDSTVEILIKASCKTRIKRYLSRNQRVGDILEELETLPAMSVDIEKINLLIESLYKLVPQEKLMGLLETHPVNETLRLLEAWGCFLTTEPEHALIILDKPFRSAAYQQIANETIIAPSLMVTNAFDAAPPQERKARFEWLAYCTVHDRSSPEFRMAFIALQHLASMGSAEVKVSELAQTDQVPREGQDEILLDREAIKNSISIVSIYLEHAKDPMQGQGLFSGAETSNGNEVTEELTHVLNRGECYGYVT